MVSSRNSVWAVHLCRCLVDLLTGFGLYLFVEGLHGWPQGSWGCVSDAAVYFFAGWATAWPEFLIEALEGKLNGYTSGDERGRGALLFSLLV